MVFSNDNDKFPSKCEKRQEYLDGCLKNFITKHPYKIPYDQNIAKKLNKIYWDFSINKIRKLMYQPNELIDHHKIIAGTQCAIMIGCLLRTQETDKIQFNSQEVQSHDRILKLNADFALYIAYDILEQWNDIDITPLQSRKKFNQNHLVWLKNVAIFENKQSSFPFFAISQLWYLAEELCKYS